MVRLNKIESELSTDSELLDFGSILGPALIRKQYELIT